MEYLVIIGALIALLGLIGLIICIIRASAAKREGLTGEEMAARLRPLIPLNLASLFCSVIGLLCVMIGVIL